MKHEYCNFLEIESVSDGWEPRKSSWSVPQVIYSDRKLCRMKARENSEDYSGECDEENCIFIKILKQTGGSK